MTRAECLTIWKAARAGDSAKLQKLLADAPDDVARNQINWKHPRKGTTPLMVAAEGKRGEKAVSQLIVAGVDVDAVDNTKLRNTALHYAAMTNKEPFVAEALLNAGADAFVLNRKGLTALDLARQNGRSAVAELLLEHMKVYSGWLYLRGRFRWKKRWAVVLACNRQRTSTELCVFRHKGDLRPQIVVLVDEAASVLPFPSTDSFCWLRRDNAFVFDKPVMCQRVKKQQLTRSPMCHKTMSHEDVQTVNYVFAAESYTHFTRWRSVLQSANFRARDGVTPLYEAPHGELYYWPHELVENVRSSVLREHDQQHEEVSDERFQRLQENMERRSVGAPEHPLPDDESLEVMLRDLQRPSDEGRRVRFASSLLQSCAPASPSPTTGESDHETSSESNTTESASSDDRASASASASGSTQDPPAQQEMQTQSAVAQSRQSPPQNVDDGLCGMCVSRRRNAVCAPCGHRAGCLYCLRRVVNTSHCCPLCRARVLSVVCVND